MTPEERQNLTTPDGGVAELPGLDTRLHQLAERVATPMAPVGDDLARGRRRLLRQRLAITGTALATTVVVGVGAALGPGALEGAQGPDVTGGTDGPAATGAPTLSPTPEPTTVPTTGPPPTTAPATVDLGQPRSVPWGVPALRDPLGGPGFDQTLVEWQRVIAGHVDPDWAHLVPREPGNANQQTSTGRTGEIAALGSKYAWRNAGEGGLGMLQLSVNDGWRAAMFPCRGVDAEGWSCRAAEAPDAATAWIAERAGVVSVAVERARDGQVVVLTADPLFGNNSEVPVSDLGLDAEPLLAAAADPRLVLPEGHEAPPPLDQAAFESAGRRLVGAGQVSASSTGWAGAPSWRGGWRVDGRPAGDLEWSAVPTYGDPSELVCVRARFEKCEAFPVDGGAEVFVGSVRARWGGGLEVSHAGPVYDVRLVFTPRGEGDLPVQAAAAFVVDPRWQPAG